ncbi:DeoR family transcriptional regulator [Peribacillus deserti]|uniref:HTH deoR-type domain-containing protein n=1 Tax=Peribacillus deserti TaxID=673318 RepID=A0A2N5M9Y8_9BACI|nr:DeoR family transcriptional regulator [Peribacillus deserti]PLT31147.1 hypothetical protein CUU66_04110 [Peribacillus deserti]
MLPIERQRQILSWLKKEDTLSITDISRRLSVSEMTVYRDIKPLIEENEIVKTTGGITLMKKISSNSCAYCLRQSENRHSVQIITNDLKVEQLCCPHCGLLHYADIKSEVSQIICRDFLKNTTISARMAYFLFDADFELNCCLPQVIAFESEKHAKQFQKGFGGTIFRFEAAVSEILLRMSGNTGCSCKY